MVLNTIQFIEAANLNLLSFKNKKNPQLPRDDLVVRDFFC
jgi:hypothetical protein